MEEDGENIFCPKCGEILAKQWIRETWLEINLVEPAKEIKFPNSSRKKNE